MSFYLFRFVNARQKEQKDMSLAVKSAVEVVLALTEKGVPSINSKVTEVESRMKVMEQNVKKLVEVESNNGEALAEIQSAVTGISTEKGPIQLTKIPTVLPGTKKPVGKALDEEETIKQARAARMKS